jgi:hypothetical protein
MEINSYLLTIIARRVPAIWDVINQGSYVALNPQPLPPEAVGARVGVELARLAWTSEKLGQQLSPVADWEDDPCGTVPLRLKLPKWLVPNPPEPDPEPWWLEGYFLGLACSLAVARESSHSEFIQGALATTLGSLTHVQREVAATAAA